MPVAAASAEPAAPSRMVEDQLLPTARTERLKIDLETFAGAQPPEGADNLFLVPGAIRLNGNSGKIPQSTQRLAAKIQGNRISLAMLYQQIHALEMDMARQGLVLVRLTLPPQVLADGEPVSVRVIDGVIEDVDVSALPPEARPLVRSRLAGLIGRAGLHRHALEAAVLRAGQVAGVALRSTLMAGEATGGVRLILSGSFDRASAQVAYGNQLDGSFGSDAISQTFILNNLLRTGEVAYLVSNSSIEGFAALRPRLLVVGGGVIFGLREGRITFAPEIVWSRTVPRPRPEVPASNNTFFRGRIRLAAPLIARLDQDLTLGLSVDLIRQRLRATDFGTDLNLDRYAAARLSASYRRQISDWGEVTATFGLSRGLGGRDSGAGVPVTRVGARSDFAKLGADLEFRAASRAVFTKIHLHGQSGMRRPLFVSEQFSLDGEQAVSGYPTGAFAADEGISFRAEVGRRLALPAGLTGNWQPYAYASRATGWQRAASGAADGSVTISGIGLGARLMAEWRQGLLKAFELALEMSRSRQERAAGPAIDRLSVSLVADF